MPRTSFPNILAFRHLDPQQKHRLVAGFAWLTLLDSAKGTKHAFLSDLNLRLIRSRH